MDKSRLSLNNNTAGVREREDANRTREAGNRDEVEGVVASSLNLFRNGAVGFIDWLDCTPSASELPQLSHPRIKQNDEENKSSIRKYDQRLMIPLPARQCANE